MSLFSSTDPLAGNDEEQPTITRRATIGDPVYDNQAIVRQRRKTAVTACERCRRRKIRCDGNQPCQTCARFGVRCAKPEERRERSNSNAEHAALADRVRQLEARLAAVSAGEHALLPGSSDGQDFSIDRAIPPTLSLDTSFSIGDHSRAIMSYSAGAQDEISMSDDFLSPNVPTIQITGPHGSIPSSPLLHSPSPSLVSGTSRASSPEPFPAISFDFNGVGAESSMLAPVIQGHIRTPPLGQWADVYNHNSLQPESPGGQGWISRRSSISSFGGLGEGLCAMSLDQPASYQRNNDWPHTLFDDMQPQRLDHLLPGPTPTKAQAEALAEQAFTSSLPIDKIAFKVCFEAVYSLPDVSSEATLDVQNMLTRYTSYSLRMARCLVFLVLTIGMRMSDGGGGSNVAIKSCYAIAMQQVSSVEFWAEQHGSQQVASLLAKLAEVSTA